MRYLKERATRRRDRGNRFIIEEKLRYSLRRRRIRQKQTD